MLTPFVVKKKKTIKVALIINATIQVKRGQCERECNWEVFKQRGGNATRKSEREIEE